MGYGGGQRDGSKFFDWFFGLMCWHLCYPSQRKPRWFYAIHSTGGYGLRWILFGWLSTWCRKIIFCHSNHGVPNQCVCGAVWMVSHWANRQPRQLCGYQKPIDIKKLLISKPIRVNSFGWQTTRVWYDSVVTGWDSHGSIFIQQLCLYYLFKGTVTPVYSKIPTAIGWLRREPPTSH